MLKRRIDGVGQLRGVGDEDAAGVGVMLRLGEQVGGHVLGVSPGIGQDGDLGRPRLGVDADRSHDGPLGGRHIDVAGTGDDVDAPAQDLSPGVCTVGVVLGVSTVGGGANHATRQDSFLRQRLGSIVTGQVVHGSVSVEKGFPFARNEQVAWRVSISGRVFR